MSCPIGGNSCFDALSLILCGDSDLLRQIVAMFGRDKYNVARAAKKYVTCVYVPCYLKCHFSCMEACQSLKIALHTPYCSFKVIARATCSD